jgi:hypothetical protein
MYFIWVIGLMAMVATYIVSGLPEKETSFELEMKTVAELMYFYHDAAKKVCDNDPAYCSGNRALSQARVRAEMPPSIVSGEIYQSNYFRSFSNSAGTVITIHDYINRRISVASLSATFDSMIGEFTDQLAFAVRNAAVFGVYDRTAQQLVGASQVYSGDNDTTVSVARTIDGVSIRNNVPMIASP